VTIDEMDHKEKMLPDTFFPYKDTVDDDTEEQ